MVYTSPKEASTNLSPEPNTNVTLTLMLWTPVICYGTVSLPKDIQTQVKALLTPALHWYLRTSSQFKTILPQIPSEPLGNPDHSHLFTQAGRQPPILTPTPGSTWKMSKEQSSSQPAQTGQTQPSTVFAKCPMFFNTCP